MFCYISGSTIFLIGGIVAIFFNEKLKAKIFLAFAVVSQFFILPESLQVLSSGIQSESSFIFNQPIGTVHFRLDPLSSVFSIIISIGSLLAAVYSVGYMKMYKRKKAALNSYYFFLGLLSSSMLLLTAVQNAILFIMLWELMSIASFFLVIFENEKEEVLKAGIYYLTAMQISAAFLIAAFSWASAVSGSADFLSFRNILNNSSPAGILLFILFFIGFGTKAGFVPMHTWLPKAHPAAPSGVSALMSGVMIKTGIYGILRILLLTGIPNKNLAYGVLILSIVTGVLGVMNAIAQHDLKKLLAYHSIENIGIIGIGIGVAMLGAAYNNKIIAALGLLGALLHTINHFTFKSVLFYGAGIIYYGTHTREIDKLGGLGKYLPKTSVLFLIASLAITGLPVFNGFISEFIIYLGISKSFFVKDIGLNIAALLGISGLAFIGSMAFLCFTKVYGISFLGLPRSEFPSSIDEKESSMLLPMILLTAAMLCIGLFPLLIIKPLMKVVDQFPGSGLNFLQQDIFDIFIPISVSLTIFVGAVLFFYSLRSLLLKNKEVKVFKTWDCGYRAETETASRMQYTSSSFAQPFLTLVAELVPRKIKLIKEQIFFPKEASFESHAHDISESYFIQPSIRLLNKFLNLFSWIQSGKMQQYIIYGLIFLIFLLIWILGVE